MDGIIGKPLPRYEAALKVTGAARYALDHTLPGMLHASLACATIARGRVTALDTAAAEAAPGVRLVLTHRNFPKLKAEGTMAGGGAAQASFRPLEGDEIRYHGQVIACIVAETRVQAEHAASLVRAAYDAVPAKASIHDEGLPEAPAGQGDASTGNARRALADAAYRVDQRYETPTQHHNPLELFGILADWREDGLTVQVPSQGVSITRGAIARVFDLPLERVRAQSQYVGGGFGSKGSLLPVMTMAIAASRELGRPVRLMVPREQGYVTTSFRPSAQFRVQLGADAEGHLQSAIYECRSQTSRFDKMSFPGGEVAAKLYAVPNVLVTEKVVAMDINTPGFMRAPAETPAFFAFESAIDELCVALRMDPLEFRRRNEARRDMVENKEWSSRSLLRCWERGAALFGWSGRNPVPGSMTRDGELIGWGAATAAYPANISSSAASCRLDERGHVTLRTAASDIGTGTYTVLQQIAAETLGLPVERVTVELGDTAWAPGNLAGGSTTALATGNAVRQAAEEARAALFRAATAPGAALEGQDPAALRLEEGEIRGGNRAIPMAEVLRAAPVEVTSQWVHPGMSQATAGKLWQGGFPMLRPKEAEKTSLSWGAEFVEVRINPRTRTIRVPRIVGVFAGGRILNARTVRSQLIGGLVWGIGNALLEATETDRNRAAFANPNLAEYHVAVNADIADVVVETVEEQDDYMGPLGVKGLGETAITGTAPAIANAVFHATGVRVRKTPILIEDILPPA